MQGWDSNRSVAARPRVHGRLDLTEYFSRWVLRSPCPQRNRYPVGSARLWTRLRWFRIGRDFRGPASVLCDGDGPGADGLDFEELWSCADGAGLGVGMGGVDQANVSVGADGSDAEVSTCRVADNGGG
jgi:hypothetical protein